MNEIELINRTKQFALRVVKLVAHLCKESNPINRALGGQLVRCGTSVGANYRAACRGRSKAKFVAKLGIVEEEADEACFWLELIAEGGLVPSGRVKPLLAEADEIVAIVAASRRTASARMASNRKSQIANRKSGNGETL